MEKWRHYEDGHAKHKAAGRPESAKRDLDILNIVRDLFGAFLQDALARKNKNEAIELVSVPQMQVAMDVFKEVDPRKITLDTFLMALEGGSDLFCPYCSTPIVPNKDAVNGILPASAEHKGCAFCNGQNLATKALADLTKNLK
jgi:hypothetical protein